jgi:transcriptional regulator with XRE-family HTH domain
MTEKTAHDLIRESLIGDENQAVYEQTVQSLLARNALLELLETSRAAAGISKSELAKRAGLEASSVRRLLTSKTANPTTDNAFRLMAAMGIQLEATLPTGARVPIVEKRPQSQVRQSVTARKITPKKAAA